jgi:hypothetical protein
MRSAESSREEIGPWGVPPHGSPSHGYKAGARLTGLAGHLLDAHFSGLWEGVSAEVTVAGIAEAGDYVGVFV